jgi:hypothetical protein
MSRPPLPYGFREEGYEPFDDDDGFLPTNVGEPTKVIGSERPAIISGLLLFGGIFLIEFAIVAIVVWWRA